MPTPIALFALIRGHARIGIPICLAGACLAMAAPASGVFPEEEVVLEDWEFSDPMGMPLEGTENSVSGGSVFHAGPALSMTTGNGTFRIQRPTGTRFFGSAPLDVPAGGKVWIVVDIAGWNLESDVSDFRLGFGNVAGNPDSTSSGPSGTDDYMLAEFSLRRTGLGGFASGGESLSRANPGNVFGPSQTEPIRLVLELNQDNDTYTLFFSHDNETYHFAGSGATGGALAPNYIRFMALNSFAQSGAFFDVDRLFVLHGPPEGNISLVGRADPFVQQYGGVGGDGNLAVIGTFLNNNENGVGIFDISDPADPVLASDYNPGGTRFQDVWVRDGIGYFGCWRVSGGIGDNGVHIVDLSNPGNPVKIAGIDSSIGGHPQVHTLFLDGDFLYTASHRNEFEGRRVKVFDVSNPASPQFVRNIATTETERVHQITVRNGRLFTSGWDGHTDIFDVSDVAVSAPLLGTIESGSNSHSSWPTEDGNVLVSAREISGGDVRFYDISDPARPELILSLDHEKIGIGEAMPHNPVITGDLLFVSWYENGLQVFDIGDPAMPVRVGHFETGGRGETWDGNWGVNPFPGLDRVLLSDMSNGLFIVDASAVLTATDNYPPLIVAMPESRERVEGSQVTFSVTATGSAPLAFQWHHEGVPLDGANEAELVLDDISMADGGSYTVTVSNGAGRLTSRPGALSVIAQGDATPPEINSHPSSQTVSPGQTATFSVTASGTRELRYQWYFNDEEIAGASASSLTVGPVMAADAGNYHARVENGAGEAVSDPATLTVDDSGFIYGVRISVGATGAVVSWRTGEPAGGFVEYGAGPDPVTEEEAFGIRPMHAEFDHATPVVTAESTAHSAYIGGLSPETGYRFGVVAIRDGARHESAEFIFTTKADEGGETGEPPEWWTEHYFGEPTGGNVDADGDGWSAWAEYLAGTSPANPVSRPHFAIERGEDGERLAYWPEYPGRNYSLEVTGEPGGEWTPAAASSESTGDGTLLFHLEEPSAGAAFFRIGIELEE